MSGIVWRDPPAPPRTRINWRQVARALRSRPGLWALVNTSPTENAASRQSSYLRCGAVIAMTPPKDYEVTSRGRDVYARFVGDDSTPTTETFGPYVARPGCGTESGARAHLRAGERACGLCRQAANLARVDRKRKETG